MSRYKYYAARDAGHKKYRTDLDPTVYAVKPSVVFAFIGTERADQVTGDFAATATRWIF